jgi:hypothetical protein
MSQHCSDCSLLVWSQRAREYDTERLTSEPFIMDIATNMVFTEEITCRVKTTARERHMLGIVFSATLAAAAPCSKSESGSELPGAASPDAFSLFARHVDLINTMSSKRRAFREALRIQLIIAVFSDA